jgi:hypothetical protein
VDVKKARTRSAGRGQMGRSPILESNRPGEFALRLLCNERIDHR